MGVTDHGQGSIYSDPPVPKDRTEKPLAPGANRQMPPTALEKYKSDLRMRCVEAASRVVANEPTGSTLTDDALRISMLAEGLFSYVSSGNTP